MFTPFRRLRPTTPAPTTTTVTTAATDGPAVLGLAPDVAEVFRYARQHRPDAGDRPPLNLDAGTTAAVRRVFDVADRSGVDRTTVVRVAGARAALRRAVDRVRSLLGQGPLPPPDAAPVDPAEVDAVADLAGVPVGQVRAVLLAMAGGEVARG